MSDLAKEEAIGATINVHGVSDKESNVDSHEIRFDYADHKRLIRKIDFRLLPVLSILYLMAYIDRGSLSNASILGYKTTIGITTTQYNLVVTAFFFTYGFFEVPAMICQQYIRTSIWIASLAFLWGTCTTLSGLVNNFGGAMAARLFVGITEAGFFPGAIYLCSNWYSREELQTRVCIFYTIGTLSGAFSGLIAYGVGNMDNVGGLESWRWLFILEGLATVLLSAAILFFLPDSPARSSWLTENEKAYLTQIRVRSGDGASHTFRLENIKAAVSDYKVWMLTFVCCVFNIQAYGFSYALPAILVELGYTAEKAQLMTVPIYVFACSCCLISAYIAQRLNRRSPMILVGLTMSLIGFVATIALPKTKLPGLQYFFLFFILSGVYTGYPGSLAWCPNNAAGPGKRAVATAIQLSLGNLASTIGTNTYLAAQAPRYWLGYGLAIGFTISAIITVISLLFCLRRENAKKALNTTQYTVDELTEMGDAAPTFKYMY